jgi:farnesyl-diphosphate farnesyltransferase
MQSLDADALQDYFLQGVSRTFALTIPVLPMPLRRLVANAYLVCRIVDTIEDDPGLNLEQKQEYAQRFTRVLTQDEEAGSFAEDLYPLLSPELLDMERELIQSTPDIMEVYRGFSEPGRAAILRCVRIMSQGMMHYQGRRSLRGLDDVRELQYYCYCVAGVVGEMLTELYLDQVPGLAAEVDQQRFMNRAVAFGQGLQLTNILKDLWDDRQQGVCWLPRDLYESIGVDLTEIDAVESDRYSAPHLWLIGLARHRLEEGLEYTLEIPARETGIRMFNLWSLFMAVLTLDRISQTPGYRSGEAVKISRSSVRLIAVLVKLISRNNTLLRGLFRFAARRLPVIEDPGPALRAESFKDRRVPEARS